MGKHTQNCTLIGKGVYGTIGVDQRSRLADGAHFHTMIVTSTLEASVIEGDKLVIKSGIVRCDGDIRVSSISGSGDIEVGGDIICDEITFTGKLRCNGDIVCSGNLSVNGSLGTRHISGQTVRLNGVLKVMTSQQGSGSSSTPQYDVFPLLIWMGMRMAARFAISQPSRLKPTICNAGL